MKNKIAVKEAIKGANWYKVLLVVVIITSLSYVAVSLIEPYKEWRIGCLDILPIHIEKTYNTSWKVCRNNKCAFVGYEIPEDKIESFYAAPYKDCIFVYNNGERERWCGGDFEITKIDQKIKNHGYTGSWLQYLCLDTSEIDYQMEQLWLEFDAQCVHLLQSTGESCNCGDNPMGCVDYLSSL